MSIASLTRQLKELERAYDDLEHSETREISELETKLNTAREKLKKENEPELLRLRKQMYIVNEDLYLERQRKSIVIPDSMKEWWKNYSYGMDFGYKALKLRKISDNGKWAIITSPGSTAGQGTAMGTGGYYYARTEHWVSIINGPNYRDGNHYFSVEGRLTGAQEEEMFREMDRSKMGEERKPV